MSLEVGNNWLFTFSFSSPVQKQKSTSPSPGIFGYVLSAGFKQQTLAQLRNLIASAVCNDLKREKSKRTQRESKCV